LGCKRLEPEDAGGRDEVVDDGVAAVVVAAVLLVGRALVVVEVVVIGTRTAGTSFVGCCGSGSGLTAR
jgi:hypothetical protein